MKLILTIIYVVATFFAGSASAFDPDDVQKLKDTNECVNCDLTDANLEGATLELAMMRGGILCNTTIPDGSVIYSGC